MDDRQAGRDSARFDDGSWADWDWKIASNHTLMVTSQNGPSSTRFDDGSWADWDWRIAANHTLVAVDTVEAAGEAVAGTAGPDRA
ncbi:MAG: hypothetical protein HOV79_10695 [Hamadaea sp.]|nr:hypothetical protein [Hamadaea sp.]